MGAPDARSEALIRDERCRAHAAWLAGVLGTLGPHNTHGASRSAGPNSRFGSIRISGRWLQCRLVMRRAYVWYARLSFAAFHPGALPAGSVCARGLEYTSCSRGVDCAQGAPVGWRGRPLGQADAKWEMRRANSRARRPERLASCKRGGPTGCEARLCDVWARAAEGGQNSVGVNIREFGHW